MLSLIVAYDKNKSIGQENTIPWRIKSDMLRVKELTTNQTIIMGRKTLDSIGRALPNRINRVLTRDKNSLNHYSNIEVYIDDSILENIETEKAYIFGGGTVYSKYLHKCDEMFITEVDTVVEADTKFPEFDENDWDLISREEFSKDENNEFNFVFMHYKRKRKEEMLEKVKVIIDSSSDLTFDEIEKYNVDVIPLTINIDGTEYDYRTISNDEYIERMRTASTYSTSQPAIGKFIEAFEKWTNEGYKVIVLTLSSALSGTYNTAVTASSEFEGVHVIDTKTTTRGMVFLLKECLKQLEENLDVEVIAENLREKAKNILTYVTIDKLDNLVKGGRLSKSQALIGGLLNIKVLTQLKETELVALDKVRGKKKLVHTLINHIEEAKQGKTIKSISLPNALADEYVALIKSELEEVFGYVVDEKEIFTTTPIISTHTGENAVGILVELV